MKRMKLPLIVGMLLISVLVISLIAFACGPAPAPTEERYAWITPPPGGTLFITTAALSTISTNATGIKSDVESVINCDVLQMDLHLGKADFGQSGTPRVVAGYDGTFEAFEGVATDNIRLVMLGPVTKTPWFSMKQHADLKTWEELEGKIILGGVTGMYMNFAKATLKYHNMWDKIKELRMGAGSADLARALIEGRVDAAFAWTGTHLYDFNAAGGYNVIEQPADEVKTIVEEYEQKGWLPTTVYKDEFGTPQDYQAAGIAVALLAGIHVPEDAVYQILKAILENQEQLAKIHEKAGMFNAQNALLDLPCPVHPGARKCYQELGLWTDALEAENQQLLDMYGLDK